MSSNSSSSFNASLLPPHLSSSNSSVHPGMNSCFRYRSSFLIFTAFSVTNILLLLPLCILVLYLGVRRRRRQRSTAASHSDIFTFHMVAMELIGIFGCALYCCAAWLDVPRLLMTGLYVLTVALNGQIPVHILTCVERYLAVVHPISYLAVVHPISYLAVHPISYLGLRERGGVRIRNVSIGLSVLRALIRPGPGEGGGARERVDRSKMRAFHIITAIMGAHLFQFGGHLIVLSNLPSSLVLPLLFLHRAGKLLCCKNSNESGRGSE